MDLRHVAALSFVLGAGCGRIGFEAEESVRQSLTLTFDNSNSALGVPSEELREFPVVAKIDASVVGTRGLGRPDCLRFVDPVTTTLLPFEIEHWDAKGQSIVWFQAPSIAAGSEEQFVKMVYGDEADCVSKERSRAVWDENFLAVFHFANTGQDSVSTRIAVSEEAERMPAFTDGQLGLAMDLDGIDDRLSFPMGPDFAGAQALTIEAWVRPDDLSLEDPCHEYPRIASMWAGSSGGYGLFFDEDALAITINVSDGDEIDGETEAHGFALGTWHYVVGSWAARPGESRIYLDGAGDGDASTVAVVSPYSTDLKLGGRFRDDSGACEQLSHHFPGTLDEIRLSNVERSAHWIAMQHRSMDDRFVSYSRPEPAP